MDKEIRQRMSKLGLCKVQGIVPTLGEAFDKYVTNRKLELKPSSVRRIEVTGKQLKSYFGVSTRLDGITPSMAKDWRLDMLKKKLTEASDGCRNAKAFYNSLRTARRTTGNGL